MGTINGTRPRAKSPIRPWSSRFASADKRSLKKPMMCWSTLTCLPGVAMTASARIEALAVAGEPLRAGMVGEVTQDAAQPRVVRGAVGEKQKLVRGVEGQDVFRPRSALHQGAQAAIGEHARDEVVAEPRIGQSPFLLHGEERIGVHEMLREPPAPPPRRPARLRVDHHALHAAGWRRALEDVAR